LAAGLATAMLLALAPFVPARGDVVTGLVLLGFAVGWALLAVLSTRLTLQPQAWAWAPAIFMGLGAAVVLLAPGTWVDDVAGWLWPPALLVLVGWMCLRARRDLRSRARVLLLYPILAVLALIAAGGVYQQLSSTLEAPAAAMPGQLVDVGGYRLHVNCTGTGSPTVVLEPGAGEMSAYSGWIAPAVARDTRVCVYDRAGRGWSDPAPSRPDGAQTASDLHTLLHRAGIPGPYLLAGHSFGGLYVMSFASQYPNEVAGMVLIDSTAPSTAPLPPERSGSYDVMARVAAIAAASTRIGVGHLVAQTSYAELPASSREVAHASAATADHVGSVVDEYAAASRSTSEAGQLTDLGATPLVVLTAGAGSDAEWMAEQDQMVTLSTNSVQRVVDGAVHASMMEDPDDAAAVSEAVQDVLAAIRTAEPLPRN
jgi:pimeloyl-ACP methyl ester carboxylesterase